jgi:hypothetical protein
VCFCYIGLGYSIRTSGGDWRDQDVAGDSAEGPGPAKEALGNADAADTSRRSAGRRFGALMEQAKGVHLAMESLKKL